MRDLNTADQRAAFDHYLDTGELPGDEEETARQIEPVFQADIDQVERIVPG